LLQCSFIHLFHESNLGRSASAALLLASLLSLVLHGVHDLEEGHGLTLSLTSLDEGSSDVSLVAVAARVVSRSGLSRLLVSAGRLLADELALRTRAESRLLALPVALGLLAHWGADSVRGSASSTALSRGAHSLALRAVSRFAQILRAANVALRLIAVNLASSARGLLAVNLALRALADRVALSRAGWVIALPSALRMARSGLSINLHFHGGDGAQHQKGKHTQKDESGLHS
jgi:hypothetical protein